MTQNNLLRSESSTVVAKKQKLDFKIGNVPTEVEL